MNMTCGFYKQICGLHSRYITAQKVQQAGIRVIIANGEREDILTDLTERRSETPHTEFLPAVGR